MNPLIKQKLREFPQTAWNFLVFIWRYCWDTPYLRFLNIGFVNLLFMFGIGILLDVTLKNLIPTFLLALLISVFHVTFSFAMRKIFIYKTKDNWLKEYLRCYLFYSVSIIVSVLVLWILIDSFKFTFWIAQALSLLSATIFYSITSRYFAFMYFQEKDPLNETNIEQKEEKIENSEKNKDDSNHLDHTKELTHKTNAINHDDPE